jgi:hypothetical protein
MGDHARDPTLGQPVGRLVFLGGGREGYWSGRARHSVRAMLRQSDDGAHGVPRPTILTEPEFLALPLQLGGLAL